MRYTCESTNQRINESTNQRIEARSDLGWLGGIRLFALFSSICLFVFLSPDFGKAFDLSRHSHFRRQAFH